MQSGKWESHHYLYNKNVSQTIPGDWRGRGALAGGADLVRRLAGCPAGVKLTLYVFQYICLFWQQLSGPCWLLSIMPA